MSLSSSVPYQAYETAFDRLNIRGMHSYNHINHGFLHSQISRTGSLVSRLNLHGCEVEGKNVLEVGCGTGNVLCRFAEDGANGFGFDIDEGLVQVAEVYADELIHEGVIMPGQRPNFFVGSYQSSIVVRQGYNSNRICAPHLTYVLSEDTISKMNDFGIGPEQMDFWYIYPPPLAIGSMKRMFRYYAKKDAVLILNKEYQGEFAGKHRPKFFPGLQNLDEISDLEFEIWRK